MTAMHATSQERPATRRVIAVAAALCLPALCIAASPALAGCRDNPGPGVDWSECRKRSVVLSGNDMTGANFSGTDMIGSDLRDTKLADIVDFLDATGKLMDVERNVHMRECVERTAMTNALPRRVLERSFILEEVWGYDFPTTANSLEVYVGYLRRKTEAEGEPRLIHTVRGVGYVLKET